MDRNAGSGSPSKEVRSRYELHMAKRILSYTCLLAGVVGLILPLLPGIPLLILGFNLLGPDDWIRRRASSCASAFRNFR